MMKKGFIFPIHSIAGLVSGLFILLLSLSGAILVFDDELDTLTYPAVIAENNKNIVSVDSCYNFLQKQYPHSKISNCQVSKDRSQPFIFYLYDSTFKDGKEAMQVFLHPQTATILKIRGNRDTFLSWISKLHGSFHLGKTGEWLLGFFALVFLVSIITGLVLYRRNVWAVLSFKKRVFTRTRLHQVIGVYALVFNLMIGVTGYWRQRYVFKKEFYQSYDYKPVLKVSPPLFYSLDSALQQIKEKYPAFTEHVIYFSQSSKGMMAIYGSQRTNSFIHSKKFADGIFLDSTGAIASTRFVNEIDPADRYDIISSQIHNGKYGGLPVKIIYCLFGLASGLLSITGFLLWVKVRRSKSKA
jgi:uncharacterized iron-regulated membrane protein